MFLAVIFSVKLELDLEEYSFSQTTIEQVFLRFAKLQESEPQQPEFNSTNLHDKFDHIATVHHGQAQSPL